MTDSKEGRRIHALAEDARESGEFEKALIYTDQAALAYQKDGDLLGLSEIQASRQGVFKHLYRQTGDKIYLILEKNTAIAGVEIAEKSGIKEALGIPYHNLAKYYSEVKDYKNAAKYFKKAVECLKTYPGRHSKPSVIADIEGHQFAAEYHLGDKTALDRALKALEDLEKSNEDWSYGKNVWLSGAHMRIAEMLLQDNPDLAKKHLQKAKEIIEKDKRLILRKHQLEKFEKSS